MLILVSTSAALRGTPLPAAELVAKRNRPLNEERTRTSAGKYRVDHAGTDRTNWEFSAGQSMREMTLAENEEGRRNGK